MARDSHYFSRKGLTTSKAEPLGKSSFNSLKKPSLKQKKRALDHGDTSFSDNEANDMPLDYTGSPQHAKKARGNVLRNPSSFTDRRETPALGSIGGLNCFTGLTKSKGDKNKTYVKPKRLLKGSGNLPGFKDTLSSSSGKLFDVAPTSVPPPKTITFKTKPMPELPMKRLNKTDYSEKEWESIAKGEKAALEASKLTNEIKRKEDDFTSKLKNAKLFNVGLLKTMATRKLNDIDLDQEIKAYIDDAHEVSFNESSNFAKHLKAVKNKYKDVRYPGSLKKAEITTKVSNQFDFMSDLIQGQESLSNSKFYIKASEMAKASKHTTLSQAEFLKLPIAQSFSIGFYGMKRHSLIAHLIKTKFEKELNKLVLSNKVVQFWSLDSFVTYILACEAAVQMAAIDMNISSEKAYEVLQTTADYGKYVTDEETMYDEDEEDGDESIL